MSRFHDEWLAKTLAAIPNYEAAPVDEGGCGSECVYCDNNVYDSEACPDCGGEGCEDCCHHGFVGYSW